MFKNYINSDLSSFHTPGHKNKNFLKFDILKNDLTELELTDELYNCKKGILKAEIKFSNLYNTKRTIFSAGGNTLCIQTMIGLVHKKSKKILCVRNIHKSVINTFGLLDIDPVFASPNLKNIKKKIKKYRNDINSVFLTSPNYYGEIFDIKSISEICKKYNISLLVDNAHGSHLRFLKENLHPINLGADLVADSLHKTLPVLTGGAVLHINNTKFIDNSKNVMSIFGSTSPNFSILNSINLCRKWLENNGSNNFQILENKVNGIKEILKNKNIKFLHDNCDPVRIVINVNSAGFNGKEFVNYLHKHKIEPEFYDNKYVVLIPSNFNIKKDWDRLEKALMNIKIKNKKVIIDHFEFNLPKVSLSIREAMFSKSEMVFLKNSKHRVISELIAPCPPGTPILIPGELIRNEEQQLLKYYGIHILNVVK
ncbi:MAG: Orn/Lys/Arg decarboxylase [Candidatus Paraimprobicoccus trichonymphae]|uniref:Orn/Lys/Arg decarboxylase n=1 Tax=Candidatus Paraimprobicoccus trichonymphae TaxID=3033793 RepID=A0AA48KVY1_9FIRM|nr:MAG: Orn/Lys/Arg decarboxylase [Candidatus Paraimprobicoccus trichonymphae]